MGCFTSRMAVFPSGGSRSKLLAGLAGLAASVALIWGSAHAQSPLNFTFALIGDLGYYPEQEPWVANVYADINRDNALAFAVHLGDLSRPVSACEDAFRRKRLAEFNAINHPVIFTPGDNDWTDCHEPDLKNGDPLERLADVRALFFPDEQSLGNRKLPLLRQSRDSAFARYRENARWEMGGVTFITLHVVGTNNGLGRKPEWDAEYEERNAANLMWLRQGFAHASANKSRAVVVLQQANLFPHITPNAGPEGKPSGYASLRDALEKEVNAFEKPVVLVHGDSHFFRIDNAYSKRPPRGKGGDPAPENFTRVETFGTPNHHWLHVTVDPQDPNVFTFRPRIVQENIIKRN